MSGGFNFSFNGNTTSATNPTTTPANNAFSFPSSTQSNTSSLKFGTDTLGASTAAPLSNLLNLSSTPAQSTTGISITTQNTLPALNTAITTTAAATSTITFKTLEEHINTWMNDLDTQEKEFLDQACQLNALDRLMIDNGEKVILK